MKLIGSQPLKILTRRLVHPTKNKVSNGFKVKPSLPSTRFCVSRLFSTPHHKSNYFPGKVHPYASKKADMLGQFKPDPLKKNEVVLGYHGTSKENALNIMKNGIRWKFFIGGAHTARKHAGQDGVILQICATKLPKIFNIKCSHGITSLLPDEARQIKLRVCGVFLTTDDTYSKPESYE